MIIRGYDPSHAGVRIEEHTVTLDGGCGFEGPLVCACISAEGEILDTVEA